MKHSPAKSMKAGALALYEAATFDPPSADWRAIAETLMQALSTGAKDAIPRGAPAWWADYDLPKTGTAAGRNLRTIMVEVRFADGESIRANAASMPSKPLNIGRGVRLAISLYRAKPGRTFAAVPEMVSVVADGGRAFDAGACNRMTETLRELIVPDETAGMSPEALRARIPAVAAEVIRRREGAARLAKVLAMYGKHKPGEDVERSKERGAASRAAEDFAMAVKAGERELARLYKRLGEPVPADLAGALEWALPPAIASATPLWAAVYQAEPEPANEPEPEPETEEDILANAWLNAVAPVRLSAASQAFLDAVEADQLQEAEEAGEAMLADEAAELAERERRSEVRFRYPDGSCSEWFPPMVTAEEPTERDRLIHELADRTDEECEADPEAWSRVPPPSEPEPEPEPAPPVDKMAAYFARQAARGRQVAHA